MCRLFYVQRFCFHCYSNGFFRCVGSHRVHVLKLERTLHTLHLTDQEALAQADLPRSLAWKRDPDCEPKIKIPCPELCSGRDFYWREKALSEKACILFLPRLSNLLWLLTIRNCCDNLNNNYCYKGHPFLSIHSVLHHSKGFTCIT